MSARVAYGLTGLATRRLVFQLADRKGIEILPSWTENEVAGEKWLTGFCFQHHDSFRKTEASSLARLTAFNPHNVNKFYVNLENCLVTYPSIVARQGMRNFNLSETGAKTVYVPEKAIAETGKQVSSSTSGERGILVTVCNTICAAGAHLSPIFVFPRVKLKPAMMAGTPSESLGLANKSGWMNSTFFLEVLEHVIKHTYSTKEDPILMIYYNHESHISVDVIDKAREAVVVLLALPPHCSHKMQPLDVSVYGPFKRFYNSACGEWMYKHPGYPMTIYKVGACVGQAFPKAFIPLNIKAGFEKTGIYSFDKKVFEEEDFYGCKVTDRPFDAETETENADPEVEQSEGYLDDAEGADLLRSLQAEISLSVHREIIQEEAVELHSAKEQLSLSQH